MSALSTACAEPGERTTHDSRTETSLQDGVFIPNSSADYAPPELNQEERNASNYIAEVLVPQMDILRHKLTEGTLGDDVTVEALQDPNHHYDDRYDIHAIHAGQDFRVLMSANGEGDISSMSVSKREDGQDTRSILVSYIDGNYSMNFYNQPETDITIGTSDHEGAEYYDFDPLVALTSGLGLFDEFKEATGLTLAGQLQ